MAPFWYSNCLINEIWPSTRKAVHNRPKKWNLNRISSGKNISWSKKNYPLATRILQNSTTFYFIRWYWKGLQISPQRGWWSSYSLYASWAYFRLHRQFRWDSIYQPRSTACIGPLDHWRLGWQAESMVQKCWCNGISTEGDLSLFYWIMFKF